MGSPATSTRVICGSRIPSGRLPRICPIALRTSLTARSVGVPIWNWTKVWLLPSRIELSISSTPFTPRIADSTRCVTCVSISSGAAPGCETETIAAGKSMSGLLFTCIPANVIRPASISPTNSTIGGTGLRMHQDEMLRKFIDCYSTEESAWLSLSRRGCTFWPGLRNGPADRTTRSWPLRPWAIVTPASLTLPIVMPRRSISSLPLMT